MKLAACLPFVLLALVQDPPPPVRPTVEGSGVEAAVEKVSDARMKEILTYLASDDLEGRHAGYDGNDKATEYIAKHFHTIGLKPVGDKDDTGEATYWQAFEFGGARAGGKKLQTRNCVGFVEGADEKLREEIVILGAHHDHVGKSADATNAGRMRNRKADPDDKIWNGADDNGSGTTTLLEVARAFMEGNVRPKRSVLFMTFSAEEYGLLGSVHYVRNPIFPLAKTVAMINMDMVGRNGDKKMDVGGTGTSEAWAALIEKAAEGLELKHKTSAGVSPGSDHYSFAQRQIPAVHLFTGFHEDYHCQTDHVDRIDFANMQRIGRFALRLLAAVADAPERPAWKEQPAAGRPQNRRILGINGEDLGGEEADELGLEQDQGGVRLTSVSAGSAAEGAGLKEDDIVLSLNGAKLTRDGAMDVLREQIRSAPAAKDVPIVVLRGKERLELKVRWDK